MSPPGPSRHWNSRRRPLPLQSTGDCSESCCRREGEKPAASWKGHDLGLFSKEKPPFVSCLLVCTTPAVLLCASSRACNKPTNSCTNPSDSGRLWGLTNWREPMPCAPGYMHMGTATAVVKPGFSVQPPTSTPTTCIPSNKLCIGTLYMHTHERQP